MVDVDELVTRMELRLEDLEKEVEAMDKISPKLEKSKTQAFRKERQTP